MTTTTNYGYNVVDGSDQVNIQNQIAPNFTAIDTDLKTVSDAAITTATHTVAGTVHQLVRDDSDRAVIRFVATGDFATGDTFTVDGLSVTARLVNGEALQTGSFKINNCVEAVLIGTVLNVNAINPTVSDAGDVSYDNTGSGLTATNVQDAIDEVKADIPSIPASYAASAITYNNAVSGLSATDVQFAIDEVNAKVSKIYSTTEHAVGTWIDGRTVYEKSYELTNPTNNALIDATLNATTIDLLDYFGAVRDSSNNQNKLNLYSYYNNNSYQASFDVQATGLIYHQNMFNITKAYLTVQYLKR